MPDRAPDEIAAVLAVAPLVARPTSYFASAAITRVFDVLQVPVPQLAGPREVLRVVNAGPPLLLPRRGGLGFFSGTYPGRSTYLIRRPTRIATFPGGVTHRCREPLPVGGRGAKAGRAVPVPQPPRAVVSARVGANPRLPSTRPCRGAVRSRPAFPGPGRRSNRPCPGTRRLPIPGRSAPRLAGRPATGKCGP